MSADKELIYIADPMCSWCWGFSPVMEQVEALLRGRAALRVLPGGLRIDTRMPMAAAEVEMVMAEWRRIAAQTGQPFDFDQPLDTNFVYDTGPSCRALSLMIRERPACALEYLRSLHRAFYVGRRDLADASVLADYALSFGVAREHFMAQLEQPDSYEAFNEDLLFVRQCGVEAFPALLLRSGTRLQRLTIGYQPYALLHPHLERWLAA